MLPAAHRLRRAGDFQRAVRRGQRRTSSTVVVHHLGAHHGGTALVGFAVGRSVGQAVVRNRVRRRLRHVMKEHLDALVPGLTVVRATSKAAFVPTPVLAADLADCLRRLEALRS
ncbi:MAG: ribonuclease P protein component [Propionibacteriales bacterium]|nr:ribonuclease P protein component [Propionibacteriales bacterium]